MSNGNAYIDVTGPSSQYRLLIEAVPGQGLSLDVEDVGAGANDDLRLRHQGSPIISIGGSNYGYSEDATIFVQGEVSIGRESEIPYQSVAGLLHVCGGHASLDGAEVRLYNDGEHDTDVDYWSILTYEEDLKIQPSGGSALDAEIVMATPGGTDRFVYSAHGLTLQSNQGSRWAHMPELCLKRYTTTGLGRASINLMRSHSDTLGGQVETEDFDALGEIAWWGVTPSNAFNKGAIFIVYQDGEATENYIPSLVEMMTLNATGQANHCQLLLAKSGYVSVGVNIGNMRPRSPFHVHNGGTDSTCYIQITNDGTGHADAERGLIVGLNSDEEALIGNWSDTDMHFGTNEAIRLTVKNDGKIGIGTTSPGGQLAVDQADDGAGIPVLVLDQADNDVSFIRFVGEAASGNITRNIVDEGDQASETRAGWIRVFVLDNGNQITDQAYYIPIYSLSS